MVMLHFIYPLMGRPELLTHFLLLLPRERAFFLSTDEAKLGDIAEKQGTTLTVTSHKLVPET